MLKQLLDNQKQFINYFFDNVDVESLNLTFNECLACKGVLVFTGVGKSGIIAKKIAQTLISTGTRSIFLPASDALHGDIGALTSDDILICLSKSGNTNEILEIVSFAKKKGSKVVSVTSNTDSRIEKLADLNVFLPLERELCPFNLAPTISTTLQIIFGDALSIALMKAKNFSLKEYALNHPKGSIGGKISRCVSDVMLKNEDLPVASSNDTLFSKLDELTSKKCGCILIIDSSKNLKGIFTDGDLRRALKKYGEKVLACKFSEIMTTNYKFISPDELVWHAVKKMEEDPKKLITVLPVIEKDKLVGLVRMHDVLQSSAN